MSRFTDAYENGTKGIEALSPGSYPHDPCGACKGRGEDAEGDTCEECGGEVMNEKEILAAWLVSARVQLGVRMPGVFCEGQTDGFRQEAEKAFTRIAEQLETLRQLNERRK